MDRGKIGIPDFQRLGESRLILEEFFRSKQDQDLSLSPFELFFDGLEEVMQARIDKPFDISLRNLKVRLCDRHLYIGDE